MGDNSRVNQNISFNRDSPEVNNVGENKEGLRKTLKRCNQEYEEKK